MPPRFTYWTIIFGGQPTAFRSGAREELLPTFKQIQAKHPDAQLRFFARGKLWYSEEEAQAALVRDRRPPSGDRKPWSGERKPWSADRGPKPEGRGPNTGERKPWSGERKPWSADRGPKPEGRGPNTG